MFELQVFPLDTNFPIGFRVLESYSNIAGVTTDSSRALSVGRIGRDKKTKDERDDARFE